MSDFKAKMYQIQIRLGLRPRPPLGELSVLPRLPSWVKGAYRKGRGRDPTPSRPPSIFLDMPLVMARRHDYACTTMIEELSRQSIELHPVLLVPVFKKSPPRGSIRVDSTGLCHVFLKIFSTSNLRQDIPPGGGGSLFHGIEATLPEAVC